MSKDRDLLLFLHGLNGNRDSWGNFPTLVADDHQLSSFDCAHFDYPSVLTFDWTRRRSPRLQLLAEGLNTEIENKYADYRSIVLACHSLGGLVARRYLTDRVMSLSAWEGDERPEARVSKAILFGTPNTGAGLARLASHFGWWQPQLKQLCRNSDFLDDLNAAWETLQVGSRFDVQYVVAAQDGVVDRPSAAALGGLRRDVSVLPDCDHRSCVKPSSREDLSYRVLKNFLVQSPSASSGSNSSALKQPKVVGFDLDGTLLRGLTFSWTLVWDHLGYSRDVRQEGMRKYLSKQCTYEAWCEWAVGKFRAKGLTNEILRKIAEPISVTKNLRPAIKQLKNAGFATCVISGGIDTFLYEKIPDADELFDEIFINRLEFDATGLISGVQATPYDFEGKAKALELVADKNGCTLNETVFVGEGFNDAAVSTKAGHSIAYPPTDVEQAVFAQDEIEEDDLMLVVEAILNRP